MVETAPGPVDCLLDLLPPAARPATVRPNGRVVLMGVSNRGVDPVSWMSIGRLVGSSLAFKRDGCQREAIGHAAANAGPFEVAVIYPQQEKNRSTVAAALPLVTGKRAP
jgi:alcohol dehydrogenase